MTRYFEDKDYYTNIFDFEKDIKRKKIDMMKSAFEIAMDTRKFEIELFWKRGTYYWAFILASFTGYFYCFNRFLGCKDFSLEVIVNLSYAPKIALLLISFVTFFFCFSWVLINKGSKFWQENWEKHIEQLENQFTGKLFNTFLNTNYKQFNKNPLNRKAYNYSVTQITVIGSIFLMIISGLLCLLHFIILLTDISPSCKIWMNSNGKAIYIIVLFLFVFFATIFVYKVLSCKGNPVKDFIEEYKWRQI